MAVDARLADLSLSIVGKPAAELEPGQRAALVDLRDWAVAVVDQYAGTSPIPDAIKLAAVRRLSYFDYHTRLARRPADGGMLDARFRRDSPLSPLRASGAMALLSPWKRRGVGVSA